MKKLQVVIILHFLIILNLACYGAESNKKINWDSIYTDQTENFMYPGEPQKNTDIRISLRAEKNNLTECNIRYWDGEEHFVTMKIKNSSEIYDLWEGTIPLKDKKISYRFQLSGGEEKGWYTSIGKMEEPVYNRDFIIIPDFKTPSWMKNAVVYQIFPDRFFDGNKENNIKKGEYTYLGTEVYTHEKWSDLPDNPTKCGDFFGGDIEGVKEKLPYLKDLGITVIYFNPVFLSPSNHKYDTQDYREVDPHFGGNKALKELVEEAHKEGIKIILDGVFNHTGSKHYWFNKEHVYETKGAYESKESPWYDFYTFRTWPDDYIAWWGFDTLPKLDYKSPKLREEIYGGKNSIARIWIRDYNIDGWRLDVPNEAGVGGRTDETGIWQEFRKAVKSSNSEAYITGEIWGNASSWLDGTQFDGVMNYNGHMQPLWRWLGGIDHNGYPSKMTASQFDEWLKYTRADYYYPCVQVNLNLLDSHDTKRFLTVVEGNTDKLRLAAIFQMTYIGAPMIYYGDEIGIEGGKDPDCRRTFNWDEKSWNKEIRNLYKKLIKIRHEYKAMTSGSYETIVIDDEKNIYGYSRFDKENKFIIILNGSNKDENINIPTWKLETGKEAIFTDLLEGKEYSVKNNEIITEIPACNGLILKLK